MQFHRNHRLLFGAAFGLFLALTLAVAVVPALQNQANYAPLPHSQPQSAEAWAGKKLYIANGCIACHTQQVRNVAIDQPWGERPSIAADYAGIGRTDLWRNTATLMGSERTGPDLTAIGARQPSSAWHLMHLFNPRTVVRDSIMPAYPWLFEAKAQPAPGDVVVNIPDEFKRGAETIVATPEALHLVAYLLSLKQTPLPDGSASPSFLYQRVNASRSEVAPIDDRIPAQLNGAALYAANCQACHQPNGEGLKGAFPALRASPIVTDEDPTRMITIIMKGYSSRAGEGYPSMPPIGTLNQLPPEAVHAIINHERSSWGNEARAVSIEEVEQIIGNLAP